MKWQTEETTDKWAQWLQVKIVALKRQWDSRIWSDFGERLGKAFPMVSPKTSYGGQFEQRPAQGTHTLEEFSSRGNRAFKGPGVWPSLVCWWNRRRAGRLDWNK